VSRTAVPGQGQDQTGGTGNRNGGLGALLAYFLVLGLLLLGFLVVSAYACTQPLATAG
jgi:hypothetical protein